MADPFTISAISIGASAGGAGLGAIGSLMGGQSKAAAANYQAGIALMNSKIAQQNATFARGEGEVEAQQYGMQNRFKMGVAKTTQAAAGVSVNSGSPLAARTSMGQIGSFEEAQVRNKAERKAYGFEVEAAQNISQAQMDRMTAGYAKTEGEIGAASSILSGIGSVSDKWLKGQQQGLWGQQSKVASAGDATVSNISVMDENYDEYANRIRGV